MIYIYCIKVNNYKILIWRKITTTKFTMCCLFSRDEARTYSCGYKRPM